MNSLLIEVYLPSGGISYDVRIPAAMNTLQAANLTANALASLSSGNYRASHNSVFAWEKNGALLNTKNTMEEENVKNGSKLLLL